MLVEVCEHVCIRTYVLHGFFSYDGYSPIFVVPPRNNIMALEKSRHVVIIRSLCFQFRFRLFVVQFFLLALFNNTLLAYSILHTITCTKRMYPSPGYTRRKLRISEKHVNNIHFTLRFLTLCFILTLQLLTLMLLYILLSGDIHSNPGPDSPRASSSSSTSSFESLDLSKNISFVHYNVQSVAQKLDVLYAELRDFDLLAFSETWLNPSISQADLILTSFQPPERKDRTADSYGGVMVYVKESLHYKRRTDLEIIGIECIWLELVLSTKHVLFGVYYRPPSTDALQHSRIIDSIHLAVDTGINNIVVTGDFNIDLAKPVLAKKIDSICQLFSFTQSITEHTHFTETSSSLLDIILVSDPDLIISSGVSEPFLQQNIRYHCPIYGLLNLKKKKYKSFKRHIWLFDKGNYPLLRDKAASIDWNELHDNSLDIYCNNITSKILEISKSCIPNRDVIIRQKDPPWFSSSVRKSIRQRKRAYRRAKRSGLDRHWTLFRELRNKTTSLIKQAKELHTSKLENELHSSVKNKSWWATLKSFIKPCTSTVIPPLQCDDDIVSDETLKANLLNNFFRDQTLLAESTSSLLPDLSNLDHLPMESIHISPDEVSDVLKSLSVGKACGPDAVNNKILCELASQLSVPLCNLFNASLESSYFPESWKEANVSPLFKSGDPSLVNNYRPISLLSTIGKVFEKIVFKHLYNYLQDHNLLTPLQSGFVSGDSTVNQLTYLYTVFSEAIDSGKEIRAIFCDISKAFDRVWHKGLLFKLQSSGISGHLLNWFSSYLTRRKQRVVLPGVYSSWTTIKAGVPQGSILGPLLFLVYINDIVHNIGANIRLFADDTSLFLVVENPDVAARTLNYDLNTISNWAKKWLVTFNPNKTESILFSKKKSPIIHPPIYMSGQPIVEVQRHKHLGLFFSHDLRWNQHIDYIKSKAWTRLNIMRRLKFRLHRDSLAIIYTTFIRPILEYGNVLFDSCTNQERDELEKINQEAARIVTGTTKLVSIQKLMQETCWETLESRRQKHKLVLFYKMTKGLTPDYLASLVPPTVGSSNRYSLRNAQNYQVPRSRTASYYNSFLPSVVRAFNDLPDGIKHADTVDSFKRMLLSNVSTVPKHFFFGDRKSQILLTRLRTNCSSLSHDLFCKNIIMSPNCECGQAETTYHYFYTCNRYNHIRPKLFDEISSCCPVLLKVILNGDSALSYELNTLIFSAVYSFIEHSKRF